MLTWLGKALKVLALIPLAIAAVILVRIVQGAVLLALCAIGFGISWGALVLLHVPLNDDGRTAISLVMGLVIGILLAVKLDKALSRRGYAFFDGLDAFP